MTKYRSIIFPFQKINEKPQVITDYEAGRAIPNQVVLGKMEKALGKGNLVIFPNGPLIYCCFILRHQLKLKFCSELNHSKDRSTVPLLLFILLYKTDIRQ